MEHNKIDGKKLFHAFSRGGKEIIRKKDFLDRINVFPVADSDTGKNLASTVRAVIDDVHSAPSVSEVSHSIAKAALRRARGNSGIIFAQFLYGVSQSINDKSSLRPREFALVMNQAVDHAYHSTQAPVEGTILTVMRAWAESLHNAVENKDNFLYILRHSLQAARSSLQDTKDQLPVLRDAGVVDAGGKGFVLFLEGIINFFQDGNEKRITGKDVDRSASTVNLSNSFDSGDVLSSRYCTEVLLEGKQLDLENIRETAQSFGDDAKIAGGVQRARLHIHTDYPASLLWELRNYGTFVEQKIDDMLRQYQMNHEMASPIALVVDSTCDLPQFVMDKYHIFMVPLHVNFQSNDYVDKVGVSANNIYHNMQTDSGFPTTSQPAVGEFSDLYNQLVDNYDRVISVHLSSQLSGTYDAAKTAASSVAPEKITVIDSRNISTGYGLIVRQIARDLDRGVSVDNILENIEELIASVRILVSVPTLKFMVRGGRVDRVKGFVARFLNLKPIISLDDKGDSTLSGKAFREKANIDKIVDETETINGSRPIVNYAIGHARAGDKAQKINQRISERIGFSANFIIDISPAIGAHAGPGSVSVSYQTK